MRGFQAVRCCLFGAFLLAGCGGSLAVPAAATRTALPASPPAHPGQIYVNGAGSTIDVFSTEASGNVAPSRVIAGSCYLAGTQHYLSNVYPMALAFDAHDDLFVTRCFGAGRTGIAEFEYPSDVQLRIITGAKLGGAATSPALAVTR